MFCCFVVMLLRYSVVTLFRCYVVPLLCYVLLLCWSVVMLFRCCLLKDFVKVMLCCCVTMLLSCYIVFCCVAVLLCCYVVIFLCCYVAILLCCYVIDRLLILVTPLNFFREVLNTLLGVWHSCSLIGRSAYMWLKIYYTGSILSLVVKRPSVLLVSHKLSD